MLSPLAPYLRDADLLLVADCVPFACADFHSRILDGRPVAIGCPKLDDGQAYVQKLSQIIHTAQVRSITVVHMEVPCCTGLLRIAEAAVQQAAADIPVRSVVVTVRGQVVVPALAPRLEFVCSARVPPASPVLSVTHRDRQLPPQMSRFGETFPIREERSRPKTSGVRTDLRERPAGCCARTRPVLLSSVLHASRS